MPGQCFEAAPTTPAGWTVPDAASSRHFNFRANGAGKEQEEGESAGQDLLDHATTLLPWIQTCQLWHVETVHLVAHKILSLSAMALRNDCRPCSPLAAN